MANLDRTNIEILKLLQEDSSITNAELAARLGLSPATTLERVRKLEQQGIIKQYVAILDEKQLDKQIKAYIFITMKDHTDASITRFNTLIGELPEVLECSRLAGEKDYLIKVLTDDIDAYERFTRTRLATIPGIDKTSTSIVLSTVVQRTGIPLE